MGEPIDVAVVGDVMVDVSVAAEALVPGGDVPGEVRLRPGGAGANAAAWATAAGARVRLHGRVGADLAGRMVCEALGARGVQLEVVFDGDARTGAMLVVRDSGDRSMVADRGANARLRPDDLPERLEAAAILVSGYLLFDERSEGAAAAALERAAGRHVAVEAASWPLVEAYGPRRFFEATGRATMLLANEREAEALTGASGEEAARRLGERYATACVKLGPRGAVLVSGERVTRASAGTVETVDPTGAGDAFDGTLLGRLAMGAGFEEAVHDACVAGARAAASRELWAW